MKKPLTERMESHKGTPKSWIAEVAKLQRTIKEKDEKIDEYGDIIDVLATQMEGWQALCMFEEKSSLHLLELIADDLDGSLTSGAICRARAGWLRRFVKAAANLETGGDIETQATMDAMAIHKLIETES